MVSKHRPLIFPLLAIGILSVWLIASSASSHAASTSAPSSVASEPPCNTWTLSSDMQVWPNQENPNRDSCGTRDVWYFMGSADLNRNPQTYYLLPTFYPDGAGISGLEGWMGSATHEGYHSATPLITINSTGEMQSALPSIPLFPNTIYVHPAPTQMIIVGWRSPFDGVIRIRGDVSGADLSCYYDGVLWYIDKGTTPIASGSITPCATQKFRSGSHGGDLASVSVHLGEFIFFAIHPNHEYGCDTTRLDISISRVPTRFVFPFIIR